MSVLADLLLGGPWQRRLLMRLGLWTPLNRLACRHLGHKPSLSNLTATIPMEFLCTCQRCGEWLTEEAVVTSSSGAGLRLLRGGKQ